MPEEPSKVSRRPVVIGKYEVLAHIATGGVGAVYKARDTENGRDIALKVLTAQIAATADLVERFRREARSASRLSHPNIVAVYDFGAANDTYYLAMEFVDGTDLHAYVQRKGALKPAKALAVMIQACRALRHAFRHGIVHRDIKPSNFLVTRRHGPRVVKLTDFGLAREMDLDEQRLTCAGTTVGTVDYMSPEQARDSGAADHRSDLYSLGGTWYYLLTGRAPFPTGGLGERLLQIMSEEPPDVRSLNHRVSNATAAVLHRLLAKDPARRYQTASDLLHALKALYRAQGDPAVPTPPGVDLPQGPSADLAPGSAPAPNPAPPTPTLASRHTEVDFPPLPEDPGCADQGVGDSPAQVPAAIAAAATNLDASGEGLLSSPSPATRWWGRTSLGGNLSGQFAKLVGLVRAARDKIRAMWNKHAGPP
jgi:serine/threonine-protein kinase